MDSESHPPSRAGGTPASHALALLRDGERDRHELAQSLGLDEYDVRDLLDQLADEVVCEDGRVRLATPHTRRPRRSRDPEHLRLRGERRAADADATSDVALVRDRLLGGELLSGESVGTWLEDKSRAGERIEHVTTSGDVVIRREHPQVHFADAGFSRSVDSTTELEPLRLLSERLAARYGWLPAQATAYVLTGDTPINGVRVTTRLTFPSPGGATRWTASFDADEDAQVVADAIRRTQQKRGVSRRRKSADAERLARLASFVVRHGTGAGALERWNREHPAERYASRSSFSRAAQRAKAA